MSEASVGDVDIIAGRHYQTGLPVKIFIQDGCIASVNTCDPQEAGDRFIAPGLVDLQVNGFAGYDVNDPSLTPETVLRLCRALCKVGVTRFLPTVITEREDVIRQILSVIRQAIEQYNLVRAMVAGIHVEGPFISPEEGPRGAHRKDCVRPPDYAVFQSWQAVSGNRIVLITLSPEWPGSEPFIRQCVEAGVKVAIGHTSATPEQIAAASRAGATLSTHLGNGAHPILPRHPNYIWEQLADDALWASIIGDGFHLPDSVLKVMLSVKGERAFLISDSVSLAGLPPGQYTSPVGGEVVLTSEGRLHLASHPNLLAGSAQPMVSAIARVARVGLLSFADAWDLGSGRPATYLGLPPVELVEGAPADITMYSRDSRGDCRICQTLVNGTVGYLFDGDAKQGRLSE